jgi:hypothetical protein
LLKIHTSARTRRGANDANRTTRQPISDFPFVLDGGRAPPEVRTTGRSSPASSSSRTRRP